MNYFKKMTSALLIASILLVSCSKSEVVVPTEHKSQITEPKADYAIWGALIIGAVLVMVSVEVQFGENTVIDGQEYSCIGGGVCTIAWNGIDTGNGEIGIDDQGQVFMTVEKSGLDNETKGLYFSNSQFDFGSELVFEDGLCSELGLPLGYTVSSGLKSMIEEENRFVILLN